MNVIQEGSILIFGASSGIGSALAENLTKTNRHLICVSRRGSTPPGCAPEAALGVQCDVKNYEELEALSQQLTAQFNITHIVNCIGVGFYSPLETAASKNWSDIVQTNITGLANVLSMLSRFYVQCNAFIHLGSLAGYRPSKTPGNEVYSATKAATKSLIDDFRRTARSEGKKTRISLLSPGFVAETDFGRNYYKDNPEQETDLYSSFKALTCQQVADAIENVLFSFSDFEISEVIIRSLEQQD